MKAPNVLNRIHVQRLLFAAAVLGFSLTGQAATKGNWGTASASITGKSATINAPGMSSNAGGSAIPMSPSIGGWTQAGNYGVPTGAATGTTMNMTANGNVFLSGTKYPFQAGYSVPWKDVALAGAGVLAAAATGGPVGAAIASMPYLIDWLTKSDGRLNPETGALERKDPDSCPATSVCVSFNALPTLVGWASSYADACPSGLKFNSGVEPAYGGGSKFMVVGPRLNNGNTQCAVQEFLADYSDPPFATMYGNFFSRSTPGTGTGQWLPASMDDIAPYMAARRPDDTRAVGEILEKGGNIPLPKPNVTGPSVINGSEKTTTNPDGSRVVERTTYNFNTAGNTITNTTNNTTTTTYNTDNSVRSVTTTSTTPVDEEQKDPEDPCKANPDRLGCMETDVPEAEIPRENKTLTWAPEDPFGSGSCPVDQTVNLGTIGKSVKVTNWTQMCEWSLPLRFIVLALATFGAFLIVMPGETRV